MKRLTILGGIFAALVVSGLAADGVPTEGAANNGGSVVDQLVKARGEVVWARNRGQDPAPRFTDLEALVAGAERRFAILARKLNPASDLAAELQKFYKLQDKYGEQHPGYKAALRKLKEVELRQSKSN